MNLLPQPSTKVTRSDRSEAVAASPRLTYLQLVRRYLPLASGSDAEFILWEMTPYPCWSPVEELERLSRVCAPVRKRGWMRRLRDESRRIYADIDRACKDIAERTMNLKESLERLKEDRAVVEPFLMRTLERVRELHPWARLEDIEFRIEVNVPGNGGPVGTALIEAHRLLDGIAKEGVSW